MKEMTRQQILEESNRLLAVQPREFTTTLDDVAAISADPYLLELTEIIASMQEPEYHTITRT